MALKNWVWMHRELLPLAFVLVLQGLFVSVRIIWLDQDADQYWVPVNVVVSSTILVVLLSRWFERLLRRWLYGIVREDWQEVRVYYSPESPFKGMGETYPREPTILISRSGFLPPGDEPVDGNPVRVLNKDGRWERGSAWRLNNPMAVSFNDGYANDSLEPGLFATGHWTELQLMRQAAKDDPRGQFLIVGFPETRITLHNHEDDADG